MIITGGNLPKLLPAGSTVDLLVSIDRSQLIKVEAFFPYLDFTFEVDVPTNVVQSVDFRKLATEFASASNALQDINAPSDLSNRLEEAERQLSANSDSTDAKMKARDELRKVLKEIDRLSKGTEWPNMERKLKHEFNRLEDANEELGDDETTQHVNSIRNDVADVLRAQDLKAAKQVLESISDLFFQLTKLYQFIGFIRDFDNHFDSYHWIDRVDARNLVNQAQELVGRRADADELGPLVFKLFDLLPENERSEIDDSLLAG